MRRVSIMVEVSDEVYDAVVEPYKKSKKFSKLIESLLTGYMENNLIASYVEGSFDVLKKESEDSFNSAIEDMKRSLASVGMMNEEAISMANQGKKAVDLSNGESFYSDEVLKVIEEKNTENESLKADVENLKRQNETVMLQLSEINNMVLKLISSGIKVSEEGILNMPEDTKTSNNPVNEEPTKVFSDDDPLADIVSFDDDDVVPLYGEEEEDEDDDFLDSLLDGQFYTY